MTDTSKRSRVQTGVPTGGEFATETRGENDDLALDGPSLEDFIDDDDMESARESLGYDAEETDVLNLALDRARVRYAEHTTGIDNLLDPALVHEDTARELAAEREMIAAENATDATSQRDYAAENTETLGLLKKYTKWGLLHSNGLGTYMGEVTLARTELGPITADISVSPYKAAGRDEDGNPVEECYSFHAFVHVPVSEDRTNTKPLADAFAVEAKTVGLRRAERDELLTLMDKCEGNVGLRATRRQRLQADAIYAEVLAENTDNAGYTALFDRFQARAPQEIADDRGHRYGQGDDGLVRPISPKDFDRLLELFDTAKVSRAMRKAD